MRRLLLVAALGACSHPLAKGPSWPKDRSSDSDGGESLAPHESRQVTVAVEKSEDADEKPAAKPVVAPVAAPVTEGGAAPAAAAPAGGAAVEETFTAEDIVIDIDD